MKTLMLPALLLGALALNPAAAEDRVELDAAAIRGNQELPKVLYIAPWKKPEASDISRPTVSLMEELLQPIDRYEFAREVQFYGVVQKHSPARQSSASQ